MTNGQQLSIKIIEQNTVINLNHETHQWQLIGTLYVVGCGYGFDFLISIVGTSVLECQNKFSERLSKVISYLDEPLQLQLSSGSSLPDDYGFNDLALTRETILVDYLGKEPELEE